MDKRTARLEHCWAAKGHPVDRNYSVFASLFGAVLRKSHLWLLLRSRADSIPIERGPSPFLCNPSAPPTSISSVSGHYKLWCLQDYLSIRGRMKCEKQSEKRRGHRYTTSGDTIMPMTDHFLTFIPHASSDGVVPSLQPAPSLSLSPIFFF